MKGIPVVPKLCLANPIPQIESGIGEGVREAKQSFAGRIPKQSLGTTE